MARLRPTAALVLVFLASGCSATGPWKIGVVNDEPQSFVLRITVGQAVQSWTVAPGQGMTMMSSPGAKAGMIELLDADTCTVLDSKQLPNHSVTAAPGVSRVDGTMKLSLIPETPDGSPAAPDNACTS